MNASYLMTSKRLSGLTPIAPGARHWQVARGHVPVKRVGRGVRTERALQSTTKIRRPSSSGTSGSPTGFHKGGGAESPLSKKGRRSLEEMASVYTLSVIAAWYFSNIGVILLNKYLLSVYGFRYPIFLTMMHMVRARVPVLPRQSFFRLISTRPPLADHPLPLLPCRSCARSSP